MKRTLSILILLLFSSCTVRIYYPPMNHDDSYVEPSKNDTDYGERIHTFLTHYEDSVNAIPDSLKTYTIDTIMLTGNIHNGLCCWLATDTFYAPHLNIKENLK